MADCPGVLHLAAMADGGLARIRIPGGALTAAQARGLSDAAARLGSGAIDLTNRANLQIRGLAPDAGPALAATLEATGLRFHGEADRRRNILLDPFSGLDPDEIQDLGPTAATLDAGLVAAPWIARLSPKFSFALDGGGGSRIGATPSDVVAMAEGDGLAILAGERRVASRLCGDEAVAVMLALAKAAADVSPEARARNIPDRVLDQIAGHSSRAAVCALPAAVHPRYGPVVTSLVGRVALALAVPVGRLDPAMLRFLAEVAETAGDGRLTLAPWSAVVVPGVPAGRADEILRAAAARGFPPCAVARRLSVVACAGAPACERAREPAKALAAEVLALAAANPALLPDRATSLHLSACPKGCAGSASADLLLLGSSDRAGWSTHRGGAPRRPGPEEGRLAAPTPGEVLRLLALRR